MHPPFPKFFRVWHWVLRNDNPPPPPNAEYFYLPPPTLRFFNPILSAKTFKLLLTGDKKTWRYDSNTQTSYPADYQQVKKHKWDQIKENKPYY